MHHDLKRLWPALRELLRVAEQERVRGNPVTPASAINGLANGTFGFAAMVLTVVACWGVSGILMLNLEGWSLNALETWFGGSPAGHPDCYLRTTFWDWVCVVAGVVVGIRTGADLRWYVIDHQEPDIAVLKRLLLPRMTRLLRAVVITSLLSTLTAAVMVDEHGSFAKRCASVSDRF